jgi:hypothetical protein
VSGQKEGKVQVRLRPERLIWLQHVSERFGFVRLSKPSSEYGCSIQAKDSAWYLSGLISE